MSHGAGDATQSINENPGEYKRIYRVAR